MKLICKNCKNCHGKGFYMEDDWVGNYVEYDCDCGEEPDYDDEVEEDD